MDDESEELIEARINFMTTSHDTNILMVITCPKIESKWQTIQQRFDESDTFMRSWEEYVNGFGHPYGNYWMGLEEMHQMTKNGKRLRIFLISFDDAAELGVIIYENFTIGNSESNYELKYGNHVGNVENSLVDSGHHFSTVDRDNDNNPDKSCCDMFKQGGWWMDNCGDGMLNGIYWPEDTDPQEDKGIFWTNYDGGIQLMGTIMSIN